MAELITIVATVRHEGLDWTVTAEALTTGKWEIQEAENEYGNPNAPDAVIDAVGDFLSASEEYTKLREAFIGDAR